MANDKAFKVKNTLELAGYNTSIGVTAVDVFVYDTSKDSDGGAWRKRTQHTSWYNETLNTTTRGSRREFPAVAVIVAEASKVTIYDGDDPTLPMWMVFTGGNLNLIRASASSISALNGYISVGQNAGNSLNIIDFIADGGRRHWSTSQYSGFYLGGISERNAARDYSGYLLQPIVNTTVNDVAMTVLPDAPIDPATGLPVPTIAVATAGGISVITDSGAVYDYGTGESTGGKDIRSISLEASNAVLVNSQGTIVTFDVTNLTADTSFFSTIDTATYSGSSVPAFPDSAESKAVTFGTTKAINGTSRLNLLVENPTTPASGMVNYITSSFQSGYQNGDIKGAFLASTDATSLVGSGELVTNGTFDTDTSGWTASAGFTLTQNAGVIDVTYDGVAGLYFVGGYQALTTVVGNTYVVTADVTAVDPSSLARVRIEDVLVDGKHLNTNIGVGSYSWTFTATSTTTYLNLALQANVAGTVSFDNISVKLADADRSVNNKGLIVNGTVTRSAVATGAELVGYSGFSASNYLEQPYNSALDFGTGDFCVMGWMPNFAGVATSTGFIGRFIDESTQTGRFFPRLNADETITLYKDSGTITLSTPIPSGDAFLAFVRRNGVLEYYINGQLTQSTAMTDTLTASGAVFRVGYTSTGWAAFNGSLALWRISATAPTADQIRKIYEDEKVLFQENAACTLYGASDAVTALAHDSDTGLLHVGTSAGRSVFQGLRRVANTTTAVGTAISASNSLVVEE